MAKPPPFPPKGKKEAPLMGGKPDAAFGMAKKTPAGFKGAKVAAYKRGGSVKK
jgi:hypothetical protein